MKGIIVIVSIILGYGVFSTLFHDTILVGDIGRAIGNINIHLFGYLAYVDILILYYPLYLFYNKPWLTKRLDGYVGWTLLIISLVVFQPLVLDVKNSGLIGQELYQVFMPHIGKAGLWLFWLMTFLLSIILLLDENYDFKTVFDIVKSAIVNTENIEKLKQLAIKFVKSIKKIRLIFKNPFNTEDKSYTNEMPNASFAQEDDIKSLKNMNKTNPIPKKEEQEADDFYFFEEESFSQDEIEEFLRPKKIHKETLDKKQKKDEDKKIVVSPDRSTNITRNNVEIVDELEVNSKILSQIKKGKVNKPKNFKLPKIDFLQKPPKITRRVNEAEIDRKSGDLLEKLRMFKINGDIVRTYTGPLVTTFEFKPAPDVKVSKILGLQDDLAMALSAETIRIQAPIPGRDVVGIEIPNENRNIIYLRDILESKLFREAASPLTVALGKDIVGKPFITDIKQLPHLLIAGTTGSGKSVGINAMIVSLLYRNDPDQLKLMMIDPKMLEFSMYDDIPHLITPVITEPKQAIAALANMVGEMERRYKLLAKKRTKNIDNYNEKIKKDGSGDEPMPFIVVVIDELADLMMNGGKEVELSIARLAQKSRACGIHLIVATQRPSVDVVTGIIKANLPSRLSYRVSQKIDSKVILDSMGAESLLGQGDGLFTPPATIGLVRIHAPWVSEGEIEKIVEFIKAQRAPEYDESYLLVGGGVSGFSGSNDIDLDELYEQAKEIILTDKKTSISYLQRKLQIGYNRSANIIEQLTKMGVLSEPNAKGQRDILE